MSNNTFAILDYDIGNVRSIKNALRKLGVESILTRKTSEIQKACALIIPGVGAFRHGMKNLQTYGLIDQIHEFVESRKPVLGICLGMQMLMEESDEFGKTNGLGFISGTVKRLSLTLSDKYRLPHIGWNTIYAIGEDRWHQTILSGVRTNDKLYFLHSYTAVPEHHENILSMTKYGDCQFVSSVKKSNIYGCQFHPEKSGAVGLSILHSFIHIARKP